MMRTFLLLWLVVQQSFCGIEGDYQVLVTVHSLVLLESRCAECYGQAGESIQRNSCCDADNDNSSSSCPAADCDVLLRFCQLSDLQQFSLDDRFLGTQCAQSPLSSHVEDLIGFNFKAGNTHHFDEVGLLGGMFGTLSNPVTYNETGKWKGAQLNILVVDRDPDSGDFDDLIDHFTIPIDMSAGSSVTRNFTGRYNYTQLELTIEVKCTIATNNTDSESCACLPGFTGQLCENDIDNCIGVTCSGRGRCVDGVQNFSCNCDPGYTGAECESEMASDQAPVVTIAGGVAGGIVVSLIVAVILVLVLALLLFKQRRTKTFDVQGVHIYDEATGNKAYKTGTSGSETLKEFNNPIYGDDPELKHEYEVTDDGHSDSKDQYQELERKFENPIYGDEDDGNLNNAIPAHPIEYDQVGNVYHTLESEQERQQRYAEASQTVVASADIRDSSHNGQIKKPQHSYEDVQ